MVVADAGMRKVVTTAKYKPRIYFQVERQTEHCYNVSNIGQVTKYIIYILNLSILYDMLCAGS